MTQWKDCKRMGCGLTALWQCGVEATRSHGCSHIFITNLLVCGIHKEDVAVADFQSVLSKVDPEHTHFYTLHFEDISEGVWINPRTMVKEKY